jgi:exopolysaccharide/PEP-CTERM locus tyrosine autokinase
MGKIFDALEKSRKKTDASATKINRPGVAVNEQHKTQEASFEKIVSLQNKNAVYPDRAPGEKKHGMSEEQVMPVDSSRVSYNKNNIDENLVGFLKPESFEAEQFKMLRTNLLFPISGKSPQSIMVTSAVPGEGKSFVSANLAVSIALGINEHVLLIDCDIRRPRVHNQFGFVAAPGLSDHLSKDIPLSSLILRTAINKLNILPAGKSTHNPSELLSSQKMSELLKEVKNRYSDRYIIIDTPPPKLTAETSAISRQVDGVLLVVEYGSTPRQMNSDLIEIIGKDKILGVILNKFDMKFSRYYGGGKYKKYSKYYRT